MTLVNGTLTYFEYDMNIVTNDLHYMQIKNLIIQRNFHFTKFPGKRLSIADKFEILNRVDKGVKKKYIAKNIYIYVFQQFLYRPF